MQLIWSLGDKRPTLRFLVHLMNLEQRNGTDDAAMKLAETLLSLNPDDNHGHDGSGSSDTGRLGHIGEGVNAP